MYTQAHMEMPTHLLARYIVRVRIFILKVEKDYLELARILYHTQIANVAFLVVVIIF